MPKPSPIIVISGPPGAGKTTLARLLAESSDEPTAFIEGDTYWQFIVKPLPASSMREARMHDGKIIIQAMTASAIRYARGGYQTFLDFTIGPWMIDHIAQSAKEVPVDYVLVCPSLEVCAERAASRPEGPISDYAPFSELYLAYDKSPEYQANMIRGDTIAIDKLVDIVKTGLKSGNFRLTKPE